MTSNESPSGWILGCEVENLRLDPQNPRLAETLQDATQEELIQEYYLAYDLDPLLISMSHSGYFSEEPLIGVRDGNDAMGRATFTVVEGNRRLAALQMLQFEWAWKAAGSPSLPVISDNVLPKLNPVPLKEYPSRIEVIPYLGVRHIRGVKDWEALAKARYVRWLRESHYKIAEISRLVGIGVMLFVDGC